MLKFLFIITLFNFPVFLTFLFIFLYFMFFRNGKYLKYFYAQKKNPTDTEQKIRENYLVKKNQYLIKHNVLLSVFLLSVTAAGFLIIFYCRFNVFIFLNRLWLLLIPLSQCFCFVLLNLILKIVNIIKIIKFDKKFRKLSAATTLFNKTFSGKAAPLPVPKLISETDSFKDEIILPKTSELDLLCDKLILLQSGATASEIKEIANLLKNHTENYSSLTVPEKTKLNEALTVLLKIMNKFEKTFIA